MSGPRVGARDRRALLVGAAVIAAVLVLTRAVPALIAWDREALRSDAELRDALAQSTQLVGHAEATRDSAAALGQHVIALAPMILDGDSPNGAGATLAGLLSGAAAQSGVRLGVVQLRADSLSHGAFTRIGAHVEATGDIHGLTRLLAALDRGPTLVAVRSMTMTQPELAAGDDRVEALRLELDVEGLMLNPHGRSP